MQKSIYTKLGSKHWFSPQYKMGNCCSAELHMSPFITGSSRPSPIVQDFAKKGFRPLQCGLFSPYHRGEPINCNYDGFKMTILLLLINQRLCLFDDENNAIDCLLFMMQVVVVILAVPCG